MRILVTGGAGFLGSHLCDRLLQDGHDVIAVDNFYTGDRLNVAKHFENSKFELIRQDVIETLSFEVDGIFNLASPASPVHYQKHPVQTIKTNLMGAINVLELANRLGCRVFQASTSEVYGDPVISPQSESYWGNVNPIGLRSCYDEGKRGAESLFFDYNRQYGVNVAIARIFNTYGPRMQFNDGRVVSNFVIQALKGSPLTIYGEGNQTRSFCYVDDLIEGFIRIFFSEEQIKGPINLGNPNEFTMLELAQLVIELTKSKSEIEFLPLPADDPKMRKPDISQAITTLGWQPKVELREGLTRTISDFKGRL
jgi:UDP-glucuronate decarboxylase